MPLIEIAEEIRRWSWFSEEKGMEFNGFAVTTPGGLWLIDPAYGLDALWKELEAAGPPRRILLTNKDHARAAEELRGRWKIPVAVHREEAPLLPFEPEETFDDDARLGPFTVVRFRNLKSPAECAFHWPQRRLLFIGDAVAGHPAGSLSLVRKHEGRAEVVEALHILLPLEFDSLLVGDGEPVLDGAKPLLERFLEQNLPSVKPGP